MQVISFLQNLMFKLFIYTKKEFFYMNFYGINLATIDFTIYLIKGKRMKQFSLLLLAVFFVVGLSAKFSSLQAQVLYFCEDVDEDGYPEKESSSFTIGSDGGWLKFLVRLDDDVDCNEVKYVIYKVSRNGKEKYDTTIYQDVEENWVWFWKKITFYDDGKYNVYTYDKYDNFLASGTVKINFRD